jgi:hypothetical protein
VAWNARLHGLVAVGVADVAEEPGDLAQQTWISRTRGTSPASKNARAAVEHLVAGHWRVIATSRFQVRSKIAPVNSNPRCPDVDAATVCWSKTPVIGRV